MKEIDRILNDDEKILWEGMPQFLPFIAMSGLLSLFGLIFMMAGLIPAIAGFATGDPQAIFISLLIPHFWIGAGLFFGVPIYRILVHQFTHYAVTNRRVIIQSGLIGRDFKFVDYDQLSNAEVNVGIVDILFARGKTGSILLSTAGTFVHGKHGPIARPYSLSNINDPYEVFKFFKKVSFDIKTDQNYPNKLRPDTNPGYKTDYPVETPEKK